MSVDKKRKKRRHNQPGLIDEFLANPNQQTMPIKLYPREVRRLERDFPEINISRDNQVNNTDLWECTISKR